VEVLAIDGRDEGERERLLQLVHDLVALVLEGLQMARPGLNSASA
jgi:hypothetical protein